MDIKKFSEPQTGTLVQIRTPDGGDHAFIPNSLPPTWTMAQELWPLLVEARTALAKLDGIGRTLPHPELLLVPLQKREAITSSRIEGTYATAQELMLFEMNPVEPKSRHDQANTWKEVANYATALAKGTTLLETLPFCKRLIQELHLELMAGVRGQQSQPGEFRQHQVAIGSDRRYVPPPANELGKCLDELERYMNDERSQLDPLVRAYIVHYQFEAIHPFADGNGRIGRVMLSLMIGRWCQLRFPWLYMSPFFERYKDEYVDNMFRISTLNDWNRWIEFCLRGTIQQANDAISRCEKLCNLKEDMLSRVRTDNTSPRTERIIHGLFGNPLVQVSSLQKTLDISYPTAQADVEILVKHNILKLLPNQRPKTYYSAEIINIAHAEITG